MFGKIFFLFAIIAMAFAAPKAEPEPKPQLLTSDLFVSPYSAGVLPPYVAPYPGAVDAVGYPYSAPVSYFVR